MLATLQDQLKNRGIDLATASSLGWRASSKNGLTWLEIPYFRGENEVGCKYRTLDGEKRFYQREGSEQCFYNINALKALGTEPLIITEGEMDCAIAIQCGFQAVSVPNGAPAKELTEDTTKYDYLADLPDDTEVIIAADGDEPGRHLLHDLSIRIGQHRCKWLRYPKGCKDLNDAYLAYGLRGVTETISRAQWCQMEGLYRMSELPPPPNPEVIDCPVDGMAKFYRLRLGDLAVVTGIPSHGKTTLVNEIAAAAALRHRWNVAIASFEQNPRIDHQRALRTFYGSMPVNVQSEEDLQNADAWIDDRFTFIVPKTDDEVNLQWVLAKCKAAIVRQHCKLIIIDPWNEMDHDFPPEMTLTRYTGFAIKQFKRLAKNYMVHIILVAHPAKLQKLKNGKYPVPSLYDISDSAHWYNKPDMGLIVHREEEGTTLVKIAKCRYHNIIGKHGEVRLQYEADRNSYRAV